MPDPSAELTPEVLDTAVVVVVIGPDLRARTWKLDVLTNPEVAALLRSVAHNLHPEPTPEG